MATSIGSLAAKLSVQANEWNAGLDQAAGKMTSFANQANAQAQKAAAAMGKVGKGTLGKDLVESAKSALAVLGLAISGAAVWQGFQRLRVEIDQAAQAAERLGKSVKEATGLARDQVAAVQEMNDRWKGAEQSGKGFTATIVAGVADWSSSMREGFVWLTRSEEAFNRWRRAEQIAQQKSAEARAAGPVQEANKAAQKAAIAVNDELERQLATMQGVSAEAMKIAQVQNMLAAFSKEFGKNAYQKSIWEPIRAEVEAQLAQAQQLAKLVENDKWMEKAIQYRQRQQQDADSLTKSLMTAGERFVEDLKAWEQMYVSGFLSAENFARAVERSLSQISGAAKLELPQGFTMGSVEAQGEINRFNAAAKNRPGAGTQQAQLAKIAGEHKELAKRANAILEQVRDAVKGNKPPRPVSLPKW